MAMSDTNSTHTDWEQHLYHRNSSLHGHHQPSHTVSSSTVVTTTTSPTSSAISGTGTGSAAQGSSGAAMQPSADRRMGKPTRRRSRASRKAPTTLLNTDTSNFRAMVQQFTGAPSGPPASAYSPLYQPIPGGSFGLGVNHHLPQQQQQQMQFGVQQQPQSLFHQLRYQQHQQQQHDQGSVFTLGGGNNNNNNSDVSSFLQGFNTANISSSNQSTGEFAMDGVVAPQATFRL